MMQENTTEHFIPQTPKTGNAEMPMQNEQRLAVEEELEHILQRLQELRAALPAGLDPDSVDKLLEATVALQRTQQEADKLNAEELVFNREYKQAARELNEENQQYLGLTDVVKNMLLWKETPEERIRKHAPGQIDD